MTSDLIKKKYEDNKKGGNQNLYIEERQTTQWKKEPEALKSLYRSPGYQKNQLVLCKNYVLQW
jgi:hypothetical protein